MQETLVWSLGQEDPLEKGTTTHSSTFAWKIPWTEEPGGLQSIESKRARPDWRDWAQHRSTIHRYNFFFSLWWELLRSSFLVTFKYGIQCFQLQLPYCTLHPHDIYCTTEFCAFLISFTYLWQPPVCSLYLWTCFFGGRGTAFCSFVLDSTCMWDLVGFVFLRLVSLSKMPSRSIRVVANGKISSFLMDEFHR